MIVAGSDDGAYLLTGVVGDGDPDARKVLDSGRVMRVRRFAGLDGVFAATTTGLYHSRDGEAWTDLGVPREKVYAVGASPDGDRIYAGTRPAAVYVAPVGDGGPDRATEWRELDGFQELPSRAEWRLPRHDDLAQVRDVHALPDPGSGSASGPGSGPVGGPDPGSGSDPAAEAGSDPTVDAGSAPGHRVVAGVEVGGVHVGAGGGGTWTERRDGVDDDVHELHAVGAGEWVAATGFGLFRTTDAGRSWTRLDEGFDQRYFRSAYSVDGTVYAGGALAHSATWEDDDADPELFVFRAGEGLDPVAFPRPDETVTGITAVDGTPVAATHRGSVVVRRPGGWTVAGSLPVEAETTGRYTPLCPFEG